MAVMVVEKVAVVAVEEEEAATVKATTDEMTAEITSKST